MTTVTPLAQAAPKLQHVAILSVWTLASGRGLVRYRGRRTAAKPSGIEAAHTALLSTPGGQAAGRALRGRERTGPLSLLRTTPVEITDETLPDGSTIRIISPAQPLRDAS